MKYKIMLIDDRLNERRAAYDLIFSTPDFEIVYIDSSASLREIAKTTPVDGYIVDALLDTGDWMDVGTASRLFDGILRTQPRPAPVFLVSNFWGDKKIIDMLNEINRQKNVKIVRYFAFQDFEQALKECKAATTSDSICASGIVTAIRSKIIDDLSIWHEFSSFRPGKNQPIRILLLSDLQYGDKHTSDSAAFDEQWVGKALNRDKLMPDLIVIAGDIAYTGAPGEYQAATVMIEKLAGFMWGRDQLAARRDRILVVPGNHDINLRLAACDQFDWSRDGHNWRAKEAALMKATPQMGDVYSCHQDFALEPFRQFARTLTGSRAWEEGGSQSRLDRRFEHCGIRFFLLNSVYDLTIDKPTKASLDEVALSLITDSLSVSDEPDQFFNMAISHHGIQSGHTTSIQIDNWKEHGKQYFIGQNIRLWMFGHYHENSAYQITEKPFEKPPHLGVIQAATLKIRPGESDSRGFSLVQLNRINGRVTAVDEYFYKLDRHGVSQDKPNPKRIYNYTPKSD